MSDTFFTVELRLLKITVADPEPGVADPTRHCEEQFSYSDGTLPEALALARYSAAFQILSAPQEDPA